MCIATARNITGAIRIRDALARSGIKAEVVSVDATITRHGCAYGVGFDCMYEPQIKRILKQRNIYYGEIIGGNNYGY